MDFAELHVLSFLGRRGTVRLDGDLRDGLCERKIARGEQRPGKPISFVVDSGTKWKDLLGTTHVVLRICSPAFFAVLEEGQFTGWQDYPVTICDKDGSPAGHGYRGLAIVGRSGEIDDSQSKMEVEPPGAPGGEPSKVMKGLFFKPETWDGSDLFMIGGALHVVVTQRVLNALRQSRIKGLGSKRLTDFKRIVVERKDGTLWW